MCVDFIMCTFLFCLHSQSSTRKKKKTSAQTQFSAESSRDHKQERIHLGVWICTLPIHFYRRYISPLTPPSCRFIPTCSQYALDAYRIHGVFTGTWLTLTRILRCHPWHSGGYDPVVPHEQKK